MIGGPLGVAGGRLAWRAFAGSLGVVPPAMAIAVPGVTRPAAELRTE